jgi:hypothetical protein
MVLLKEDQGKMQAVINSMLCWTKLFKPRNILLSDIGEIWSAFNSIE